MALDKSKEAKFTFKKGKIYDTDVEVVYVSDANNKDRRVCMIHPESGTLSFTFRGTLTDFSSSVTFYSIVEMQMLLDAAKKINTEYNKFDKQLGKVLGNL